MEIRRSVLEDAIYAAGYEPDGDRDSGLRVGIREAYSGRAMYGDTCLGLVTDGAGVVTEIVLALARAGEDEAADALARAPRTDSMGFSMITYWPGVELVE